MSQQDVYRAKVLYNWHIQAFLRDVAMAMGFDKNKSNSMGASIAQIAGRYIVENDMEMDFQAFEFNPYDNKPVNGWSPAAQPAQSKYDDGTGYRVCGIFMSDEGFSSAEWYNGYTNKNIKEKTLPPVYAKLFREQAQWHEKTHCFLVDKESDADYIANIQMMNKYADDPEMLAQVKAFLNFHADMYDYAYNSGYLEQKDESKYAGSAVRASIADFEKIGRKMTEEEIWTMIADKQIPAQERYIQIYSETFNDAMKRHKSFLSASEIKHVKPKVKVNFGI